MLGPADDGLAALGDRCCHECGKVGGRKSYAPALSTRWPLLATELESPRFASVCRSPRGLEQCDGHGLHAHVSILLL
jgi:hypothetical protein